MRNPIVRMPETSTAGDRGHVLHAAIRQLDRAEIYLAAVDYMDLDDREARRAVTRLRAEVEGVRRYLAEKRSGLTG